MTKRQWIKTLKDVCRYNKIINTHLPFIQHKLSWLKKGKMMKIVFIATAQGINADKLQLHVTSFRFNCDLTWSAGRQAVGLSNYLVSFLCKHFRKRYSFPPRKRILYSLYRSYFQFWYPQMSIFGHFFRIWFVCGLIEGRLIMTQSSSIDVRNPNNFTIMQNNHSIKWQVSEEYLFNIVWKRSFVPIL